MLPKRAWINPDAAASPDHTHLSKVACKWDVKGPGLHAGEVFPPDRLINSHWQEPCQLTKVACHSLDVGVVPVRAVDGWMSVGIDEQLAAVAAEHAATAISSSTGSMGCGNSPCSCIL